VANSGQRWAEPVGQAAAGKPQSVFRVRLKPHPMNKKEHRGWGGEELQ